MVPRMLYMRIDEFMSSIFINKFVGFIQPNKKENQVRL